MTLKRTEFSSDIEPITTAKAAPRVIYLAAFSVYLHNLLDSIQVIHARIHADLVEDYDPGLPRWSVQLSYSIRDVTCCYDVGLVFNGKLDNGSVISVGHE